MEILSSSLLRRLAVVGAALLLLGTLPSRAPAAESAGFKEYQVKAVFLFNFAQFVTWPPEAFASPDAPIVIGVLGENPFGGYLEEAVRGEKIGGRALIVRQFTRVEEVDGCHILFVSGSESDRFSEIMPKLAHRPILTVGDTDSFARQGGMIRFVTESNRIRLRINLRPVREALLTISSKLLRPAEIVGANPE